MIEFIGIIPARKGSVAIKDKNLIKIKKKKLIEYTLDGVQKSKYLKKAIITTDDVRIIRLAKKFSKMITYKRSSKLSKSTSKISDAIVDVLNKKKDILSENSFFVLLQPTSPQRKAIDIDNAIIKFLSIKKKFDSLVTVSEPFNHPREILHNSRNRFKFILKRNYEQNRQKYFKSYFVNGSILITSVKKYKKNKSFFLKNTYYMNTSKKFSVDLNDEIEKKIIETLI